jgi:23S rRNA (cytosine1962-C5)-methyltransferase
MLLPSIDRATRRRWVEEERVRVAGRIVDRPGVECASGVSVEIDIDDVAPLPPLPSEESGEWLVWVDEPAWFGGVLDLAPDSHGDERVLHIGVEERVGGLARLCLSGPACGARELCRALGEAGMPIVGDLVGGGLACPSGVAIASRRTEFERIDVFEEPPWPEADSEDAALVLRVSKEASRALARRHPWVLPDDASDSAEVFRPGSEVRVEDRAGAVLGWAWTEGEPRISARMSAVGDLTRREIPSIEARVARALARRRALFASSTADFEGGKTDCFRLVHGEGDGLPGLFIDRLGPLIRVLVTSRATDAFRGRAIDALLAQLPTTPEGVPWSVLELLHLRSDGRGDGFDRVRWIAGGIDAISAAGAEAAGEGFWVEERGLRFWVDPGWGSLRSTRPGYGLFPDQRQNRERLAGLAISGGRWLNLFAHTGAFSVSLLAAGAEEVLSVDLSSPYLARLEVNLAANRERGVDPGRHRSLRGDGRHVVESMESGERFSGIVLDPPTAAAAGRRFWSVRQDLEPLLRECLRRLDANGKLLVTQNGRGASLGLDRTLERVASRLHRRVRTISPAGPAFDHPRLEGFPEGDAFEGWLIELDG